MTPVADLQRLLERAAGSTGFKACIQFISQAVLGSHDFLAGCFGKALKSSLNNFSPMSLIKTPGMLVKNIGVKIQHFFRIRDAIGFELYCLVRTALNPDPVEFRQDISFDVV